MHLKMAVPAPKVSIYLDVRRPKPNTIYPVRLRVHYNGQTRMFSAGFKVSEDAFEKAQQPKPRAEAKELKWQLSAIEEKAAAIIKDLKPFSFPEFEKKMFRASGESSNAIWHYDAYIDKLKKAGRIGTAESYQQSLNSLKAFVKSGGKRTNISGIPFESITPDFLNRYESWMLERGKSKTTVGIYLRALRAIFNVAIEEGDIDKALYPFSRRKYQVPAGRNIKKALSKDALKNLFNYPTEGNEYAEKARDFWFLSYLCNGMNIRDIAELKGKNVSEEVISFVRTKTERTTKGNTKPIVVPITGFIRQMIAKYGTPNTSTEDYLFPILKTGMSEEKKRAAVKNFTRFINQHLKPLAKAAGLSEEISTYWARHSFTTMAIRNGASMEMIQESLGHNDLKTTMNYWGGFEEAAKREIADKLLDF